jgi:mRNA interferase MazF
VAYRFGDVLLVPIIFSDTTGAKNRPVLVVHDTGDADFLAIPITSHPPRIAQDVTLQDWRAAGLRLASTARMSKLATIAKTIVIRRLGRLTEDDAREAGKVLNEFFSSISQQLSQIE